MVLRTDDLPFRSAKQRRFMWARHPRIARRWTKKYGSRIYPKKKATRRRRKR